MYCICQHNKYCDKDKISILCSKEDYEKETGKKILTAKERDILDNNGIEYDIGGLTL